ncbi:extracellular solute-binding protein [Chitinilyticum piscinae]|uniref:Extracellular solute-binding protein n=1 Tax=Chitinilyticum piscinae TaxID=2866724 RepID=A0A8J7FG01_9NEIS|nr:extracellular solute-binding protein [Chitinilyticum piscinae]MBE9608365.1 extracellular solute-binding protein [Chitinilyticum piscinae]
MTGWKALTALLLALLLVPAQGIEVLRVLAWPGYAEKEQVRLFEKKYNVSVVVSYVSSDDELWRRVSKNNGGNFDVVAINTAELQRLIDQKLVQPIDAGRVPNLARQLPRYRTIPALSRNGQRFAVPYAHSEMGLIYNRQLVSVAPQSLAELWNPKYRNQVLAYDGSAHNFSIAAQLLGFSDPFHLSAEQMQQAMVKLIEQRPNVLAYYKTPEEVVDLFNENKVALVYANYGEQQVQLLRKAGADIGYVIPKEGALAWLDCWAILRGARNRELAHAWLNFSLDAEMSRQLVVEQGLGNTLQDSDALSSGDKIIWLEPVENPAERANLWARILGGHRSSRP